ncbi:MAG: sortase [Lachnospiraceae bacterium]|nr:sortase [Lachnospiraceae bacterium]
MGYDQWTGRFLRKFWREMMTISRKLRITALCFLILALVSFIFAKETVLGILRQKADSRAAEAYLEAALDEETEVQTEKMENDEASFRTKSSEDTSTERKTETAARDTNRPTDAEKTTNSDAETIGNPTTESAVSVNEQDWLAPSYTPVTDDAYYERGGVVYTPEHAVGRIDCVLEIPKISLKRCVYSGTDEEIAADLDMWFTVSASGALVPGETHYAIFGHNHTVQNLSFNRLGEMTVGDWFTLTRGSMVYIYLVTDVFASERASGRRSYAYDNSMDPSRCYIFTCGRDYMLLDGVSTRYKDFIVEGTLWKTVPLRVWQGIEAGEETARDTMPQGEDDKRAEPEQGDNLQAALSEAAETVRRGKTAPVLTITREGSLFSDGNAFTPPGFSWSMLMVWLTGIFAALFMLFLLMSFLTLLGQKRPRPERRGQTEKSVENVIC